MSLPDRIVTSIEKRVSIPMALVTNIGTAASGVVTSLLTAAAGHMLDTLKDVIDGYLGKNIFLAKKLAATPITDIFRAIDAELKTDWTNMISLIKAGIGQGVGSLHGSIYEVLTGSNALLQTYNSIIHQVAVAPYVERWASRYVRPNVFSAEAAWLLGRLGQLPKDEWKERAKEEGWPDADVEKLPHLYFRPLDLHTLLEMLRRRLITEETFTRLLQLMRLNDEQITAAKALKTPLYPLPDFMRMVVREAFIPEEIVEAPPLMVEYIRNYGWDKVDADRYWTAHFIRMDLRQAYENVWRGYMDLKQFEAYLRLADIHPKDWQWIINVIYRPPTIRELGYGYDVGVYTLEDIIRYRRWGGLSPEDAEKAARAMVAYRTEAEREAVRRAYLRLYTYGHITREQFQKGLEELGTAPAAIPLWLQRGDLERQLRQLEAALDEPRTLTRKDIQWGYEHGIRTKEWCTAKLAELGFTEEAVAYYTEQSSTRLKESELEALRREYTTLYAMEKIDRPTLEKKLVELKTHPEVLNLWLERAELEREKRKRPPPEIVERYITPSEAIWAYENGLRPESWLRTVLAENYWTKERIDLAIETAKKRMEMRIKPPKEIKYKELTLSHLEDLLYHEMIREAELPPRIEALGYDPEDAKLLARLITKLVQDRKTREEEKRLEAEQRTREAIIAKYFAALRDENIRMYVEGLRTQDQIRLNFQAMDVPEDQIDLMLAEAELKAEIEDKLAWKTIYIDAYRLGDIDDAELVALLLAIPIQPEIVKREYIKARIRKTPKTPLQQIFKEYPDIERRAREIMKGWT